jgi:hypothetical protein
MEHFSRQNKAIVVLCQPRYFPEYQQITTIKTFGAGWSAPNLSLHLSERIKNAIPTIPRRRG